MTAKIIAICNQKGGPGKTTLTMQLAGSIARQGFKTLVVDADPQGSATRWAASAAEETPFPTAVVGLSVANGKVHQEVKKLIHDFEIILIDCPPAVDSPIPQSALLISDLALVPVVPSPLDMWASVGIREIISNVSHINETLKSRLVLNQYQPNTTLAKEALQVLPDFGIEVANHSLGDRQAYRQSALFGQTVHDFGNQAKEAIEEIDGLAGEVLLLLGLAPRPLDTTTKATDTNAKATGGEGK
jgi:chromosome partitioning protein